MKKISLFAAVLMVSLFSIKSASAQVNLNINIGCQPLWGPTGYDHVEYYYLPDIDAYYYVPSGQYIYANGGRWIWTNNLPARYGNFDLYQAYKVVINEPKPYLKNNTYATKYGKFKNYNGHQKLIRDSRDKKYDVVKGHPNYNTNKPNKSDKNNRPSRNGNNALRPNSKPSKSDGKSNFNKDNNAHQRNGKR